MPSLKITDFNFLKILIFGHFLVAGLAILNAYQYFSWYGVRIDEITRSPDAAFLIRNLHKNWWFCKGLSCGFLLFAILLGIYQRKSVANGGWKSVMHWFLLILPGLCVFWYGWDIA